MVTQRMTDTNWIEIIGSQGEGAGKCSADRGSPLAVADAVAVAVAVADAASVRNRISWGNRASTEAQSDASSVRHGAASATGPF